MVKNERQGFAVYDGNQPYLFISYSHKDMAAFSNVMNTLSANHVRLWYDNGLHSGDDWNLVIANHLQNAALCLLLLSPNSAGSNYVKNELNFAVNHRIPIHVVMLERMVIPPDIEIMLGRIQMIEMTGGYEEKLINVLPPEIFAQAAGEEGGGTEDMAHPLYAVNELHMDRQGTQSYKGMHKRLKYPVMVQADVINPSNRAEAFDQAVAVSALNHPIFPHIYDVVADHGRIITYQEFRKEVFLDEYLKTHKLTEAQILRWVGDIASGLNYLYRHNLAFRDLARGSMLVLEDDRIGMFRLQNLYYGVIKLRQDNRQYYFENTLLEIAVLISQLCTGETPVLPLRIFRADHLSKKFLRRMNLVAQKCIREYGKTAYQNFEQLLEDLSRPGMSAQDGVFLLKRSKKLEEYDRIKGKNMQMFTGEHAPALDEEMKKGSYRTDALEQEFGFESTICLDTGEDVSPDTIQEGEGITLLVCSTGQVLHFSKGDICIGRSDSCDVVLTQPSVSRMHVRIAREDAQRFTVSDMNTSNGSYVSTAGGESHRIMPGESVQVSRGEYLQIGSAELRIL